MVKIHGNYCGPNWTGGRNLPANSPKVNWNTPCIDALDCACKNHDRDCAHPKGCSAKADRVLSRKASIVAITNPRLRNKAAAVASMIAAISVTRSR
jgi:hypothetical protein